MNRGEIWWADLPDPYASEPGYRRPVLVLQADTFNQSGIKTVICVGITSNVGLGRLPGNVVISPKESNLKIPSVVNITQVITVDRAMLTECVGSVAARAMRKVNAGLKLVLGLT